MPPCPIMDTVSEPERGGHIRANALCAAENPHAEPSDRAACSAALGLTHGRAVGHRGAAARALHGRPRSHLGAVARRAPAPARRGGRRADGRALRGARRDRRERRRSSSSSSPTASTTTCARRSATLPRGRGILGVLIRDAQPLRLHDLTRGPAVGRLPARAPADAHASSASRSCCAASPTATST